MMINTHHTCTEDFYVNKLVLLQHWNEPQICIFPWSTDKELKTAFRLRDDTKKEKPQSKTSRACLRKDLCIGKDESFLQKNFMAILRQVRGK